MEPDGQSVGQAGSKKFPYSSQNEETQREEPPSRSSGPIHPQTRDQPVHVRNPIHGLRVDLTTEEHKVAPGFRNVRTLGTPTEEQGTTMNVGHFEGPPIHYARPIPNGGGEKSESNNPVVSPTVAAGHTIHFGSATPQGLQYGETQATANLIRGPVPVQHHFAQQLGNMAPQTVPVQPMPSNVAIPNPAQHHQATPCAPQVISAGQQSFLYQRHPLMQHR